MSPDRSETPWLFEMRLRAGSIQMVQSMVSQAKGEGQLGDNRHAPKIHQVEELIDMLHRLAVAAIVVCRHVANIVQAECKHRNRVN